MARTSRFGRKSVDPEPEIVDVAEPDTPDATDLMLSDPRYRTADGVLITEGMRVTDYDRRNAVVRITGTPADPRHESHEHWNGWFTMETPDGANSSTMNGDRLMSGWLDNPHVAEDGVTPVDPDDAIDDETLAAIEDDAPDADTPGDAKPLAEGLPEVDLAEQGEMHGWAFNWESGRFDPDRAKARKLKTGSVRPCLCNRLQGHECDLTTKTRFAIGHDARFKSILQAAFRKGEELVVELRAEDGIVVDGTNAGAPVQRVALVGEVSLPADEIARLLAPKLLPHVTHVTRTQRQAVADKAAGTALPRSAVEGLIGVAGTPISDATPTPQESEFVEQN